MQGGQISVEVKAKVKFFIDSKGWGYVIPEDGQYAGKDCFVHFTGILKKGYKSLAKDEIVLCEIANNERGLCAINVKKSE